MRLIGEYWVLPTTMHETEDTAAKSQGTQGQKETCVGDLLVHPTFGQGIITEAVLGVLTIDFGEKGSRRLGEDWVQKHCSMLVDDKVDPGSVVSVFITASADELYDRLCKRGTETQEQIQKRLQTAIKESYHLSSYTYVLTNSVLSETVNELQKAFEGCLPKNNVFDDVQFRQDVKRILDTIGGDFDGKTDTYMSDKEVLSPDSRDGRPCWCCRSTLYDW